MSDPASPEVTAAATSAQSLRDIAKWLVGGIVATAAGVFAGSSLTSLGSLDPISDRSRMLLALGGLLAGFAGLIIILIPAIRVLTVEMRTFREFAKGTNGELRKTQERLLLRYRDKFPGGVATFAAYQDAADQAQRRLDNDPSDENPTRIADTKFVDDAEADFAVFNADAGFTVVRRRFSILCGCLAVGTPVAIAGFGVFAWAANPPTPKSPPPAFSLTIQGKQ